MLFSNKHFFSIASEKRLKQKKISCTESNQNVHVCGDDNFFQSETMPIQK